MDALTIKNEWLADLLIGQRDTITECWIEDIRAEHIPVYESIPDEQLRTELPPTVDSMLHALRTGDTEGPRRHSVGVIRKRLAQGLQLPDLQMSLHALETAVMRIVDKANVSPIRKFEAMQSASAMYYMVALIAATVYEQLRAEQQTRFATAYEFGITLSRDLDLTTILDTAVAKVAEYTNGESVAILLASPGDDRDEVRAFCNLELDVVEAMPEIRGSLSCADPGAVDPDVRQTSCAVPDVRDHERLGSWSEFLASHGWLSILCAPLVAKQRRLGSMLVMWPDTHIASNAEMDFLYALAGHIANAVQNAILYEEAKGKRELGLLLHSSKLFASSLDTDDVLQKIARMATEAVNADLAVVVTQHKVPKHSHTAHFARGKKAKNVLPRVVEAVVSEGEQNNFSSLGRDFAKGKAVLYHSCAEFSGQMKSLTGLNASGMVVPLRRKDALLGAFALISLVPDAFNEEDLSLAAGLGDLAAVAIENAQSYEYERNIAETLQRSFLPANLPSIKGYETAAYYRPAMAEAAIGGDFYDVFTIENGDIGIVIGDVSGKGLKAAIPTAMGKYLVRAYAAENLSPAVVMARFNRSFFENAPDGLFMTSFYGSLNPKKNLFTYASAGHDPPLLYVSESRRVEQVSAGGICLGVFAEAEYADEYIKLKPGDALLLYTDGATDVKVNSGRLEVGGLEELFLSNAHRSAEEIVRSVSDGIWDYSRGRLADDVALVVLKRLESSRPPNS